MADEAPPRVARLPAASSSILRLPGTLPRPRLTLAAAPDVELVQARGPGLPWLVPGKRSDPQPARAAAAESEPILPPGEGVRIPLAQPEGSGEVEVTGQGGLVSLVARNASLNAVLTMLAEHCGLNVVLTEATNSSITISLKDVRLEDALDAILAITGNAWLRKNNIILVTNIASAGPLSTGVQGTVLRVFELDYAAASDVAEAVKALLSPLGRSFINQMDKADNHKTKEIVVVEDLPHVVRQIEGYIRQVDAAPKQVLIEACILKIDLKRTDLHGVNLNRLFSVLGHHIQLQTLGFASATANQAFLGSFDGNQMGTLVECLQETNDAKTLAKPRVLCLNGQEASFQVGKKLGYKIISTSQTSTMQSINFLNVGVILHVTPRISRDRQILMRVKPEVSDGSVDQTSGLPSSNTTDVQTDILLGDGRGIVIGGLIQETDNADIAKIPVLGDIWLLGRLFQRRNIVRERSEVVIFIVPRIVPYDAQYQCLTQSEIARTQMPLLGEQFARHRRPGEPALYDAVENPRPLFLRNQRPGAAPTNRPFTRRFSSVFSKRPMVAAAPPSADSSSGANIAVGQTRPASAPTASVNGAAPTKVIVGQPGQLNLPPPSNTSDTRWVDRLKNGTLFR